MVKIINSIENDTNHDADLCNTKYISIENSTEDNADDNLEGDVSGHRRKPCQLETPSKFFEYFAPMILISLSNLSKSSMDTLNDTVNLK